MPAESKLYGFTWEDVFGCGFYLKRDLEFVLPDEIAGQ